MKKNKPNIVNFGLMPKWFPQTALNNYIHDYLNNRKLTFMQEQLFFDDLVNRLNQLPFIKNFQLYRRYMRYFKKFSSIHATAVSSNFHFHQKFNVNVSRYGFDSKIGESVGANTFEFLISYYLFKSGSIGFQCSRPLIRFPNFQNKLIFPFFKIKCCYDRHEFYEQIISSKNFEAFFVNSNNSFSFSLFANDINYHLSPNHSSYFDKECYPFSCIGFRSSHDFDACDHLLFIRNTNTKISIEPLLISKTHNFCESFPMVTLKLHSKVETIFNATLHLESGYIFSPKDVPLCKRLYVGGIPTMRGIRYSEFSSKVDEIPLGSYGYFASGIDQSFSFYSDSRIRGHVFLNAGISAVSHSERFRDNQSNFVYFMS